MRRIVWVARLAGSIAAVAVVTAAASRLAGDSPTTVALGYVLVVLLIATRWGIAEATAASLAAVLSFNYFFLPPIGTWTIADPQNWIALVAFLLTAIIASQISGRARLRHIEALDRQRDLERLYALSRALLLSEDAGSLPSVIAQRMADTFDLRAVALYDAQADAISLGGAGELKDIDHTLREVARQAVTVVDPAGVTVTAIRLGGAPIGSLALMAEGLSDTVLQSMANLAAIALERARGQEVTARAEAARQSGELRATVLDALAHEFKTPLTSLKMASSDLQSDASLSERDRELVAIIDEESTRLQGLVTDVVQMLRIDAGDFVVRHDRHRAIEIVDAALACAGRRLEGHHLENRVPGDLVVAVDADLIGLAVRQLVDNAIKYSPPSSTIAIEASGDGTINLTVRNSGSVIPQREQARLFERFYRGTTAGHVPGTGIGLSIVQQIARAHGGHVTVQSTPETGTAFVLSIPRETAS